MGFVESLLLIESKTILKDAVVFLLIDLGVVGMRVLCVRRCDMTKLELNLYQQMKSKYL